jgi:hypothetical protein
MKNIFGASKKLIEANIISGGKKDISRTEIRAIFFSSVKIRAIL